MKEWKKQIRSEENTVRYRKRFSDSLCFGIIYYNIYKFDIWLYAFFFLSETRWLRVWKLKESGEKEEKQWEGALLIPHLKV